MMMATLQMLTCLLLLQQLHGQQACKHKLTEPTGELSSPNHPAPYPPSTFCVWEIEVGPYDVINLEFLTFDLELSEKGCAYDHVTIIDGNYETKLCGSEVPDVFQSRGNKLTVILTTDAMTEGLGFRATYTATSTRDQASPDETSTPPPRESTPQDEVVHQGCGGTINDVTGIILSPGYPHSYPSNQVCVWNILAPIDRDVYLTFDLLDMELSELCLHDYVEILDDRLQDLGRYCGSERPVELLKSSQRMTVIFKTNSDISKRGFAVSYSDQPPQYPGEQSNALTWPPTTPTTPTTTQRTTTTTSASTTSADAPKTAGSSQTTPLIVSTAKETPSSTTVKQSTKSTDGTSPRTTTSSMNGDDSVLPLGAMLGVGFGVAAVIILAIIVVTVCLIRRNRRNAPPLVGKSGYSTMAASSSGYAQPYQDGEGVDPNQLSDALQRGINKAYVPGLEGVTLGDPGLGSAISTPWGTLKRSQMSEMAPHYLEPGREPQLGSHSKVRGSSSGTVNTLQ